MAYRHVLQMLAARDTSFLEDEPSRPDRGPDRLVAKSRVKLGASTESRVEAPRVGAAVSGRIAIRNAG